MCKIMMLAGIKPEKTELAWKLISAAVSPMSKHDKDGLGYAAITRSGDVFAERWLNPKDAFKTRQALTPTDKRLKSLLGDAVELSESYSVDGTLQPSKAVSIMLHTRMATCTKGIENTHPFVSGNTALIHNGVINNAYSLTNITSTCDSEVILNEYVKHDVSGIPDAIERVAMALQGYYACGVLGNAESGPYLDVFKDERAKLVAGYVKELDCVVFCTNAEILSTACKKAKMTLQAVHVIKAGYLIRLDAVTGRRLDVVPFDCDSRTVHFGSPSLFGSTYAERLTSMTEAEIDADITKRIESVEYLKVGT